MPWVVSVGRQSMNQDGLTREALGSRFVRPIDGAHPSRRSRRPAARVEGCVDGCHPPWPQGVTFAVPGTAKCPGVVFPLPVVAGMWLWAFIVP
jgi:hypothetical protein